MSEPICTICIDDLILGGMSRRARLVALVKDHDLMQDTGGATKHRPRSPDFMPPREQNHTRKRRRTPDQWDQDVDLDPDAAGNSDSKER